jgi:hypothetical protein
MEGPGEKELVLWDDAVIVARDATPLDFLTAVYRDAGQPMARRLKAAIAAAQYVHPKLAVMAQVGAGDLGARLDQIRQRTQAINEARAAGRLVEFMDEERAKLNPEQHDGAEMAEPFLHRRA